MSKKEFGRIVNITSIAVPLALEGESCYGASKAAVEHLTKVMAKEFAAFGITINAIGPCLYETSLIKGLTENKRKEILKKQMIPRFCQFSDIIQGIEFFMDPKSSFYSGQIIYLGV